MGLTCSLLGHAFDGTDVERDRSEQGSEVVTVVRELEVCGRCGETRVVSENKEVTSIVEPGDGDVSGFTPDPPDAGGDSPADDGGVADPVADSADEATTEPDARTDDGAEPADAESTPAPEPETPPDPSEEDAEILDDTEEGTERAPGEWPGSGASEPASDAGPAAAVDLAAEPDEEPPEPAAGGVPDGDYVCPECGFGEPIENSSLRAGDACPECQRGYLEAE